MLDEQVKYGKGIIFRLRHGKAKRHRLVGRWYGEAWELIAVWVLAVVRLWLGIFRGRWLTGCACIRKSALAGRRCRHSYRPRLRIQPIPHMPALLPSGGLRVAQQPAGVYQFLEGVADNLGVV